MTNKERENFIESVNRMGAAMYDTLHQAAVDIQQCADVASKEVPQTLRFIEDFIRAIRVIRG